ncbi:hypothetical protein QR680_013910 [Steinernema hermaphroditum]|uniref:ShKT domain-containing protein n=1 Tax=Steinernema hermaphroditum TaxID=289476 RepID=A0AA39I8I4_9BILA|nr:hypothetical protein QR680_013910 [Steinernema hermaphroditum]
MCVDAAPATYCTMNRHFCREPSLTVSTDCAKSCEVCNATPAVESSCSDEAPICSLLVNHCGDASQFDYLSKNCAKTCKFCGDTTTPEPVKNLCHLYNTETWGEGGFDILKKCPVTCNLCDKRPHNPKTTTTITPTPQNCIEDKQCPEWASNGLCIHPFYPRDFLQRKCPLSCGFCGVPMVTPDPQSCIDEKGCTTWVSNGFCTNTFYTPELRRQKCSRSCGFCGGPMSNGYTNNYQYTRRTTVNYNAGNGNGVCVDKKAECATQASCNSTNPTYLAWVRDLCPRTCGVC